jgi:hypothetical protein
VGKIREIILIYWENPGKLFLMGNSLKIIFNLLGKNWKIIFDGKLSENYF